MTIEWGSIPDWVSALANVGVAAAAGVAAWQGVRGLHAWRDETLGRRRMELAEEALADFYEARDVLRWVRSPMSYSSESENRQGREDESADVRRHRDTYYVALKRLTDHKDFFAKMAARRYRVIAAFGTDAEAPYTALNAVRSEISAAADTLMQMQPSDYSGDPENKAFRKKLQFTVWQMKEDDELGQNIAAAISQAEAVFRPTLSQEAVMKYGRPERRRRRT